MGSTQPWTASILLGSELHCSTGMIPLPTTPIAPWPWQWVSLGPGLSPVLTLVFPLHFWP